MKLKNFQIHAKSEFTRRCIGEAIIRLMEKTEFVKLKISDIVKKAGVSRTTFYKYYTSTYEVLTDYLSIIVSEFLMEGEESGNNQYFEDSHILFSFHFFDRYADFFLTLSKHKLHSIMLEGVNEFMKKHIQPARSVTIYQLYAYAGALLNSFLMWEEGGKQEPVEEIAANLKHIVQTT